MQRKILSIIGARPQFIKYSSISNLLKKKFNEILIHTGQHYDYNMSKVFFDGLNIPSPKYNLKIGSGLHSKQTGMMMVKLEEIMLKEKPDVVMVFGDTNTTLAGSLASVKLKIKLAHIEAGLRSFNKSMPEEINRICTDHISDFLFCPSKDSVINLKNEGITKNVFDVGDIMKDTIVNNKKFIKIRYSVLSKSNNLKRPYYYITIHRQENTDNIGILKNLLDNLGKTGMISYFPVHPRTKKVITSNKIKIPENIILLEPLNYLDNLTFQKYSEIIFTDSGGVQKEAYYLGVPCITLREETEWKELVKFGYNKVVGHSKNKLLNAVKYFKKNDINFNLHKLYGDGKTAKKIVKIIENFV